MRWKNLYKINKKYKKVFTKKQLGGIIISKVNTPNYLIYFILQFPPGE